MTRILIADDHPVLRRFIRKALEAEGWQVCGEATNGREAVVLAGSENPDIVVLDLSMPELSGLDAAREIRQKFPRIEMLILTVDDAPELVSGALALGARACLPKSELHRLVAEVHECVRSIPSLSRDVSGSAGSAKKAAPQAEIFFDV